MHVEQHLQPEFRWVYKAPSRLTLGSEVGGASAYPCSLHVPSSQDAGPMGDQNPKAYVHKGGVRILSYLSMQLAQGALSGLNMGSLAQQMDRLLQEGPAALGAGRLGAAPDLAKVAADQAAPRWGLARGSNVSRADQDIWPSTGAPEAGAAGYWHGSLQPGDIHSLQPPQLQRHGWALRHADSVGPQPCMQQLQGFPLPLQGVPEEALEAAQASVCGVGSCCILPSKSNHLRPAARLAGHHHAPCHSLLQNCVLS
jgi:hypothetical protein